MVRFFKKEDRESVISLWQEAFGDKKEEITVFLDFFEENLLVFEEDGQIVSMITLIRTQIEEYSGRYVYAVATDEKFRGMGYASQLIEFAKKFISDNNEKFLILVPQENSLFDFYKKRGFSELCCAEKVERKINFDKNMDVKAEILDAKEYFSFRQAYFSGEKYAMWDINMLGFMKNSYKGEFFALKRDNIICGAAFCYTEGNALVIPELLQKGMSDTSINSLGNFFGAENAFCIKEKKCGERFAMIYPQKFSDAYFGLAMK